MHKGKLINLLKVLTKTEFKEFDRYIRSSFFNRDQRCVRLWEGLQKYYPHFTHPNLKKSTLIALVFPNNTYTDSSFRSLLSQLTKLVEQYLILLQRKQDDSFERQQIDLLKILRIREQEKYFVPISKQLEKGLATQKENQDAFHHNYAFQEELLAFALRYPTLNISVSHNTILHQFSIYAAVVSLSYWCAILNKANFKQSHYDPTALMTYYQYIGQSPQLLSVSLVHYYYNLLGMLIHVEEPQYFHQVKQQLEQVTTLFHKDEAHVFYTITLNYCNQKVITGDSRYYREMFVLYQAMLAQNLLERDAWISPAHLKNITTLGLRLQEFEWTKTFITAYKNKTIPKYQDTVFHFNMGTWHFYQQQYGDALVHFIQVDYIDSFYYCEGKSLVLKCYYELEESEAFLSLISTFKSYLRREKSLSKQRKKAYHNFIGFMLRLYKIKALLSPKSIVQLIRAIEVEKLVSDRAWLLVKAKGL